MEIKTYKKGMGLIVMTRRYAASNVTFATKHLLICMLFCALILAVGVSQSSAEETATNTASKGKTEIVVDDDSGTVSILINGETAVLIDANGLHVKESIEYGGTIRDTGNLPKINTKIK